MNDSMLEELLGREREREASPTGAATPKSKPKSARARAARRTGYERWLHISALVIVIVAMVGVWWTGGYMTLVWLASLGVPVGAWGVSAWGIPLAVTALQMGVLVGGSQNPRWMWIIFAVLVLIDVGSSAAGLVAGGYAARVVAATDMQWGVSFVVGAGLAFAPEPVIRSATRILYNEIK